MHHSSSSRKHKHKHKYTKKFFKLKLKHKRGGVTKNTSHKTVSQTKHKLPYPKHVTLPTHTPTVFINPLDPNDDIFNNPHERYPNYITFPKKLTPQQYIDFGID